MFHCLYPDAYAEDVFSIDYKKLYDKGYRGILFDVDNTLVHHNEDATKEVENLFMKIQSIGFKTILVSNNDAPRLERFLKNIDSDYVCDAGKPQKQGYVKALEKLGVPADQAVFIGDQMFVDIYGANKVGIDSIMVHFVVVDEKEFIGIRRYMEKFVLFFYNIRESRHKLEDIVIKG